MANESMENMELMSGIIIGTPSRSPVVNRDDIELNVTIELAAEPAKSKTIIIGSNAFVDNPVMTSKL